MKYAVIPNVMTLLTTVLSVFILSCDAGDASVAGRQQSMLASAPGSPVPIAGGPNNVLLGDMNKDGKPDMVVASDRGKNITVLLGQGDGQFRVAGGGPIGVAESPGEMALGDVNSDSKLDLVFVTHDSYGVTLLFGDGKGGLALAPTSPIVMKDGQHPHTHGLGIGDFNGDGKLDLATVNNADNDVSVAFGDARGSFTRAPGSPFAVGPSPYPLSLGDVNNDGHLDIVATTTATGPARSQQLSSSRALTLLLGDGRGGFRPRQVPVRTGQPWFVAIGDVNGDRKSDLLTTHAERNELTVLIADRRGGFAETSGSPLDWGRAAWHMGVADLNRDGRLDVIAAAGDGVRVMLGDGRGGFEPAPQSPFPTGKGTWRLALGDVNGDGKSDVVTSNAESNTISVLLGQ